MRKIDKSIILSKVYKQWEEQLEASASKHPKYTSSNFRYFDDIKMNLFHCQNGLCAYTEKRLCPEGYGLENWNDGRYTSNIPESIGHLEHFDESLKANKAWLWDNLFMVLEMVNVQKSNEPINNILKPDHPEYNENALLAYNHEEHIFFANVDNPNLTEDQIESINKMIYTLGINKVKSFRKQYLLPKILRLKGRLTHEPITQFPTAFEMTKRNLGLV
jgi:hypothetical protein